MTCLKPISAKAFQLHSEQKAIDIHCHPSLKIQLFGYDFHKYSHSILGHNFPSSPDDEMTQMQYDLPKMSLGGVGCIWSSVYVVEKEMLDNCTFWIDGITDILQLISGNIDVAIEDGYPESSFENAKRIIYKMEASVLRAKKKNFRVRVAKNFQELKQAMENSETVVVHTLEGAHHLGRGKTPDEYRERIRFFKTLGVCSMTLGHFIKNDICSPCQGMSPYTREQKDFEYDYTRFKNEGLSEAGKAVVDEMFEAGMIVDLNHVNKKGREDVYRIINERRQNGKRIRPVVFSHVGIRDKCNEEVNPTGDEILQIRSCGGVIGIIFMKYWLVKNEDKPDYGINDIVDTIQDIATICNGEYDTIAIGSDMDGFTQPVDDLYSSECMMRLTDTMIEAGISDDNIKKILGGNAMRVMENGWGNN